MTNTNLGASEADDTRNRSFGAGHVDDPYPRYHERLQQCPVHEGSIFSHFPEMPAPPPLGGYEAPTWSVYSYDGCLDVLRRPDTFSSKWYDATLTASIGKTVISLDAPEHRRHRVLLQNAFQRRQMQEWRHTIIGPIVDGYLDHLAPLDEPTSMPSSPPTCRCTPSPSLWACQAKTATSSSPGPSA